MNYLDLTRLFDQNIPVYPGDSLPRITILNTVEVNGFTTSEVASGMHVGTHMDAPLHFIAEGKKISEIPVEKFFGRGVLVDARDTEVIDANILENIEIQRRDIVLVLTGWANKFGQDDYFTQYPVITIAFAERLVESGASMIGIDSASPDRSPFETHKKLLSNGVLVMENLVNLDKLIGVGNFTVVALPTNYATESAPVRVVAMY